MSLETEIIAKLTAMLQSDPALVTQLQSATDTANTVALLVPAAEASGIDVNAAELTAYLQEAESKQAAMSDAELEQVAGGGMFGVVAVSVFMFLLCAGLSIAAASKNNSCKQRLLDKI